MKKFLGIVGYFSIVQCTLMLQYMIFAVLGILFLPAYADNSLVLTVNTFSEFTEGQNPIVYGYTTNSNGNAISDVDIQVGFPSRIFMTSTNSTGQYSIKSPIPAEPGTYTIHVTATKDRVFADAKIQYSVNPKPQITIQDTKDTNSTIQLDPFSKMLQQIEQQKHEQQKAMQEAKQQNLINEQRRESQSNRQNALEELQRENESHSPRNAFLGFLADVDHSIRSIFWQQFLFTESITIEAQKAKQNALDSGKSSLEGTKIFQKKAAVSKKEIIEYNKKISIEYGNATMSEQERFDEYGKLPRD